MYILGAKLSYSTKFLFKFVGRQGPFDLSMPAFSTVLQNHKRFCVRGDLKDHLFPAPPGMGKINFCKTR